MENDKLGPALDQWIEPALVVLNTVESNAYYIGGKDAGSVYNSAS